MDSLGRPITRRRLIALSAGAVPFLVVSCGGDSDGGGRSNGSTAPNEPTPPEGGWSIASRWIPTEVTTGQQRLPVSLADVSGLLSEGPSRLTAKVVSLDTDEVIVPSLYADRRSLGEGTIPFWVFVTNLDATGFYALVVDGGPAEGAAFQVVDPSGSVVARAGDRLPPFDTPTFDDPRGVAEICTRTPEPCPFHAVTLTDALNLGKPVVYLVGTPAHCQTGVCGPVLDQLVELSSEYGDSVTFVHADVYADTAATEVAPAVTAAKLTFEPVVFVTDATGTIVRRLDAVWDVDEVRAALA